MRFAPIALFLALAAPASATPLTGINGFTVEYRTLGLARNVQEGLWVGVEFTVIGTRCAGQLSIHSTPSEFALHDLILFNDTGKAIGFGFRTNSLFNTFFTVDPGFDFPTPGAFQPREFTTHGALGFFQVGDWLAEDPMAFDTWYRAQVGTGGAIPEPATALLLALGLLGLANLERQRAQ